MSQKLNREMLEGGLVTIGDAATFLRLGRSTVYQLLEAGQLPSVKIGRARRIPRAAIVELAARHLVGNGAGEGEL
jgi:excisionase family DNA binding protein